MKFLYFTDVHDTMKSPSYRKDNYHETVLKKLAWIGKYASDNDYDFCLCGGDLFDTPGVSNAVISSVAKCIRNNFGVPVFSIAGNHDLYGNNSYNITQTAFGVLSKAGIVRNLCDKEEKECVWEELDKLGNTKPWKLRIVGVESKIGIDDSPEAYLLNDLEKPDDEVWVLVIHSMLRERKSTIYKSTGLEDIMDTKADIVLSGHDHGGFKPFYKNGKIFANPGALLRVSTANTDINLDVKVASIEVRDKDDFSLEYISLPKDVALPYNEVLDVDRARSERASRTRTDDFAKRLGQVSKHLISTGENDIDVLQSQLGFSKEVRDLLEKYLTQAEQDLKERG